MEKSFEEFDEKTWLDPEHCMQIANVSSFGTLVSSSNSEYDPNYYDHRKIAKELWEKYSLPRLRKICKKKYYWKRLWLRFWIVIKTGFLMAFAFAIAVVIGFLIPGLAALSGLATGVTWLWIVTLTTDRWNDYNNADTMLCTEIEERVQKRSYKRWKDQNSDLFEKLT